MLEESAQIMLFCSALC